MADTGTVRDAYFRDIKQGIPINGNIFKRRGAWTGLFVRGTGYGASEVYLGTLHGAAFRAADKNRLINIYPTYDGRRIPFAVQAEPAELTLLTRYGNVRFTFANTKMIMAEGDTGMGLGFNKLTEQHETIKKRRDGAWEAAFRWTCSVVFKGLNGSEIDFGDVWNWERLSSFDVKGFTKPGPDGRFTLVMEEFSHAGWVRDAYPAYAEAKADMQVDWESFYAAMPKFTQPYEKGRFEAEYTLWSLLTEPTGTVNHTMIVMIGTEIASQWQMCQNAVALQEHLDLAIDLLLSPIDRVAPTGQLSDLYNDATVITQLIKPPVHGWAVKQIIKNHDLVKEVPRDKLELLYSTMSRWADWFMKYRDEDGDGLPAIEHGDETGFDDCTLFINHMQVVSPDIIAYLVLLFEANGDLAKLLGRPESEASGWQTKSTDLLSKMVSEMWDGQRFVGLVPYTHEHLVSDSFIHFLPIVLGDRLPKHIVDKIADDLTAEGEFLCEYGIATERINSDYFEPTGRSISRGNIVPPGMIYICTGLFESHRKEEGRMIANRYCTALMNQHMPFLINPLAGSAMSYHGGSWPACAYTIIGRLLTEDCK